MSSRDHRRILCVVTFWVVACAASSNRPPAPQPPPPPHVLENLGYVEVTKMGADMVQAYGYNEAELQHAAPVGIDLWRVHFGLAPKGSGRFLELEFDGPSRRLVKFEEWDQNGLVARLHPLGQESLARDH